MVLLAIAVVTVIFGALILFVTAEQRRLSRHAEFCQRLCNEQHANYLTGR